MASAAGSADAESLTFTAASSGSGNGLATWNHTVPAGGQNRYLLLGVSIDQTTASETVASASYAGQALSYRGGAASADMRVEIWGLADPPEGTGEVSVQLSASAGLTGGATSFTGVDATPPPGPVHLFTGQSAQASVYIPSSPDDHVFTVFAASPPPSQLSVQAPQVRHWWTVLGAGSSGPGASPSSVTWTLSPSREWIMAGIVLHPSASSVDGGTPDAAPDTADPDGATTDAGTPDAAYAHERPDGTDGSEGGGSGPADGASADRPSTGGDATVLRRDLDVRIGCACRAGGARSGEGPGIAFALTGALALLWRRGRRSGIR